MTAPATPSLPFPVFQVSQKVQRYLLYDVSLITWLRQNHNILGVLIGSLPQIPQQNVFLGLPLELQAEEARLLVEDGLAYIVDDLEWHMKGLASGSPDQKDAVKANLRQEGAKIAKDFASSKKSRTQKALKKIHGKTNPTLPQQSSASPTPAEDEDPTEDSLFTESLTRDTTKTPPKPWTLTPTTSYPLLPPPPNRPPSPLPKVNPASYALFKHLHSLNYFLTPGLRFGCQFSVYPGDPLRFHSHFLTMSADWDDEIDLLDLVGGGRLGTGVKKGWLVGGVEREGKEGEGGDTKERGDKGERGDKRLEEGVEKGADEEGSVRTFCIEWGGM